ncbi:hypothetical protein HBI22_055830 [Parastagonospora nodorum]|nr:hypothetical protein HBI28_124240 [Parastagonospora nodorum]KAH5641142.1 hypothetical protein HBI22_055830 [Parastagonospora nodorum]
MAGNTRTHTLRKQPAHLLSLAQDCHLNTTTSKLASEVLHLPGEELRKLLQRRFHQFLRKFFCVLLDNMSERVPAKRTASDRADWDSKQRGDPEPDPEPPAAPP